MEDRLKDSWAW